MEEKVNNITINLTSLVDYIRDKDLLIDCLRYEGKKQKEVLDKIKKLLKRYNDKEANMYAPIQECLDLLEEIK